MSGVQQYCQTTSFGCENHLEALFSCPQRPNIVHWVWFWPKKTPECNFRGFFIRTKSEYTGFDMDVGIVTVLSNYIVRVLNNLEALFTCPHLPNIVHWVWFWHPKPLKMDLSGYFIRTNAEYTGINMDVEIVTVLSNYIVLVLKQPGSIVYMSPPFKHSVLGVILTPKTT